VVEEWLEIAVHGRGKERRFEVLPGRRGIAQVRGLLGVRGGISLVCRCGVVAEVFKPPPLPI
jgi:hypothetical protein